MDVTLFIVSLLLLPALSNLLVCERGWFGSKCQFMCRCTNLGCDADGFCRRGEQCLKGWFGPACQYEDIAYNRSNSTEATDGDDNTCVDSVTVKRVFVFLIYPLKWIRVHFQIPGVLDKFKVKMWGTNSTKMCYVSRNASVDNRTIDIHCLRVGFIYSIVVYGVGAHYVCSVYVTGGRNVAMKQTVSQTSTYIESTARTGNANWTFPAELAVDGDRNRNLYAGNRCAMTRNESMRPGTLSLWLSPPCVVNKYYIFNIRDAASHRLKGFILESYNVEQSLVYRRKDTKTYIAPVYEMMHGGLVVSIVNITANNTDNILHVCELEIYGEYQCPSGLHGLECDKTCNCVFNESCFISTGGCPSGCANGYFGRDCTTSCAAETFGPNCKFVCSPFCVKFINQSATSCNRVNGTCLFGCTIGYKGSSCDVPCAADTYGPSCNMYCSPFCVRASKKSEPTCSHVHGECFYGCDIGYDGPICNVSCAPNTYGKNCQFHCSTGCLPSGDSSDTSCHHITGACVNDCASGYNGTFCNTTCAPHTYGENISCSQQCLPSNDSSKSSCNHVTGACLYGCVEGYNGTSCTTSVTDKKESFIEPDTGHAVAIVVISAVVAIGTVVAIVAVVFCVRKKENLKADEESE